MASFASAQEYSSAEDLVEKCFSGNTEAVTVLLENGVCANSEFDGWTPLAAASLVGHSDVVKVLLEHGAKVNMQCTNGAVALVGACAKASVNFIKRELNERSKWASIFVDEFKIGSTEQIVTVNLLIEYGADINMQDDDGYSALMAASYSGFTEAVQVLLMLGAQVNMTNYFGGFALRGASIAGYTDIVKLLLNSDGVEINMQSFNNTSSLMVASMTGHVDIVELLLHHGAEIELQDYNGNSALLLTKSTKVTKALLGHGANVNTRNKNNDSALINAAMMTNVEMAKILIAHGAILDAQCKDGYSALIIASGNETGIEIASLLLDYGAKVNAQTELGDTALIQACLLGHIETARLLLDYGAQVNMENVLGVSALSAACMYRRVEIIQLLLDHGASCGSPENTYSPLNCAIWADTRKDMPVMPIKGQKLEDVCAERVSSLLGVPVSKDDWKLQINKLGAKQKEAILNFYEACNQTNFSTEFKEVQIRLLAKSNESSQEITPLLLYHFAQDLPCSFVFTTACVSGQIEIVRQQLECGIKLNANEAYTALTRAIFKESSELVLLLLSQGDIQANITDDSGVTALMIASIEGRSEIVNILLDYGAQVNMQDRNGNFALLGASLSGYTEITRNLLDNGAIVDMQNKVGYTALMVACTLGQTKIVEILLSYGAHVDCGYLLNSPLVIACTLGNPTLRQLSRSSAVQFRKTGNFPNFLKIIPDFEKDLKVVQYLKDVNLTEEDVAEVFSSIESKVEYEKIIKLLLKYGADTEQSLLIASVTGQTELTKLILENQCKSIHSNVEGDQVMNSLHIACFTGNYEMVKLILEIDPHAAVRDDESLLLFPIALQHKDAVEWLVREFKNYLPAHDDIISNNQYNEVVSSLIDSLNLNNTTELLELLLSHGAKKNVLFFNGLTPLIAASAIGSIKAVKCLLDHGAKVNMQGRNGLSPLIAATCNGHSETVKLLLDHNAEVNMPDNDGDSALIYAVYKLAGRINKFPFLNQTQPYVLKDQEYIEIVRILLCHGAKDGKNNKGMSAQIIASIYGRTEIVKLLIDHGSQIDCKAVDIAIKRKHLAIVELLLRNDPESLLKFIDSCPELQSDPEQEMVRETISEPVTPEMEQIQAKLDKMEASLKLSFKEHTQEVIQALVPSRDATHKKALKSKLPVSSILDELRPLASEWHDIGVHLGLSIGQLKEIEADYRFVRECLREMIYEWLANDPNASWDQLVEALVIIDHYSKAAEIHQKYCMP